ncbi:hypothetical protein Tco_0583693 [Tanacetum coccineum]
MYTTNYDQLYAYLSQHEGHTNEVRLMRKRYPSPLALVATHHHISSYPNNNSQYNTSQYQQQLSLPFPQTYNSSTRSQDGRVIVQQVQGRQRQGYDGNSSKSNATTSGVKKMGEIMSQVKQGLSSVIIIREKGIWLDNALSQKGQGTQHDLGILVGQDNQTTMPINAAFQTDDLNAFDSDCHEALGAQAVLMANFSSYDSDVFRYIVHICVNSLATLTNYAKMEKDYIDKYSENLMLKAELAKKEQMIEKKIFNEVVLRCSRLENRNVNLELKLQHQKESFLHNRPLNNQNAPEILEFFKINEWQAKLVANDVSIANLRKHIESLKGKNVVEKAAQPNNDKELVKHARALRPLDSDLDYVYKYAKQIQEVLVYVTTTCLSLPKPSEKLVAITPLNKNRKVRFTKPVTSSSNTQIQVDSHKTQDSNKPVLPSTGMKSSTRASRSQHSGSTKNNRISQTTSSNIKNKVEDHSRNVKSN